LHKSLLSDLQLVAIKLDDKGFQGSRRRAGKDLSRRRETAAVARAEELTGLFLPGHHAAKVGADRREGNKLARRWL
jgi:hypothetical protein